MDYILGCYFYKNELIIELLLKYKLRIPYTDNEFFNFLKKERQKYFVIPMDWYLNCIKYGKYDILELFYRYEKKSDFSDTIMENYYSHGKVFLSNLFILTKMIINKKIKFNIDNSAKLHDVILYRQREELKTIISNNSVIDLFLFLKINKKNLEEINSENFDVLYYAIKYNRNITDIRSIIDNFNYSNFNYLFQIKDDDDNNENITPLMYALEKQRFDICNMLLMYGADINYKMLDENMNNIILIELYERGQLNVEIIHYLFKLYKEYNIFQNKKLLVSKNLIKALIMNYRNDCFIILINELINETNHFDNSWYETALECNNFTLIDELYKIDKKDSMAKIEYFKDLANKSEKYLQSIYALLFFSSNEELKSFIYYYIISCFNNIE